jgi:hypothetical protein
MNRLEVPLGTRPTTRAEEYNKKYGDYLIGKEGDYKCGKCRKIWLPTDADINKKLMMTYYKNCGVCRLYLYNKCIEYRNRDK